MAIRQIDVRVPNSSPVERNWYWIGGKGPLTREQLREHSSRDARIEQAPADDSLVDIPEHVTATDGLAQVLEHQRAELPDTEVA